LNFLWFLHDVSFENLFLKFWVGWSRSCFYKDWNVVFVMRILFRNGGQRAFLDLVIRELRSPSLRGLLQFGFDIRYSTLKNYYVGARLMPKGLVLDFCEVAGIGFGKLDVEEVGENWGRVKGGKVGKRK